MAIGLAAGVAIPYLIEVRLREDPNVSPVGARNIGTAVNVGALGIGTLADGFLAQWMTQPLTLPYVLIVVLGAVALIGVAGAPETGTLAPRAAAQGRPTGPAPGQASVPAAAGTIAAFAVSGLFAGGLGAPAVPLRASLAPWSRAGRASRAPCLRVPANTWPGARVT